MEITILIGVAALAGWLWLAYRCVRRGRWSWVMGAVMAGAVVLVAGLIAVQPLTTLLGTGGLEDLGTTLFLGIMAVAAAFLASLVVLLMGAFGTEPREEEVGSLRP